MTTNTAETQEILIGRVKWFNSNSGFGFITLSSDSVLGVVKGTDVFVHHNSIKVSHEQYRYLVQGEYVELSLGSVTEGPHQYQAVNVCGINGGKLMCETIREVKGERNKYHETKQPPSEPKREVQSNTNVKSTPRVRGEGPREGGEWTYVVKSNRPNSESNKQSVNTKPPTGRASRSRVQDANAKTKADR